MIRAIKLLKAHGLRQTNCRMQVLGLFLEQDFALASHDLEQNVGEQFDRVTVYRTLKSFLDKGLIHKVPDDGSGTKYALCSTHCSEEAHHDDHVHFKCTNCGMTTCLEEVELPKVALPEGYSLQEINLLIQGVCKTCEETE